MAKRCLVCSQRAFWDPNSNEVVNCNNCNKLFHSTCVNLRENDVIYMRNNNTPFVCNGCNKNKNSDDVLASPRNASPSYSNLGTSKKAPSHLQLKQASLVIQNQPINNNSLDDIFAEFKAFKNDIVDRLVAMDTKLSTFVTAFTRLEESNKKLSEEVNQWKSKFERVESYLNNNSIDICGVPFVENESLFNTITHIVNTGVGVNCSINDIDYCYRKTSTADRNNKTKSEIVSVRFISKWKKEEIMLRLKTLIKAKNYVTTKIINAESSKRIYFNELLTPYTRQIFNIANRKRKENKLYQVWIRNSKVFVRAKEGDPPVHVKATEDLNRF